MFDRASSFEHELRSSSETRYHWSSASQDFTPVAVLQQYLMEGWCLPSTVYSEAHWYGGGRHITVYHLELIQGEQTLKMRVKSNPVIRRLLCQQRCEILRLSELHETLVQS